MVIDYTSAFAVIRQQQQEEVSVLEVEYLSRLQALGIYYGDGLFGSLSSQAGFTEIRAWRNSERQKISDRYLARVEGVCLYSAQLASAR